MEPNSNDTVAQQETGGDCVSRLVGLLVFAGDLEVNGEEISGCALDIDRATLIAARSLPMFQRCVIVTAAELQKMEAVIEAAKCIRHWHDRDGGGMVVSAADRKLRDAASEAAMAVPVDQIEDAIKWTESYLETLKVRPRVSRQNVQVASECKYCNCSGYTGGDDALYSCPAGCLPNAQVELPPNGGSEAKKGVVGG